MVWKGKPASVTTGSRDRTYLCPEIIIVIIIIIITVVHVVAIPPTTNIFLLTGFSHKLMSKIQPVVIR